MSSTDKHITAPHLAARYSAPLWLVRRLCDRLSRGRTVTIGPRIRLIPADVADEIVAELRRLGRIPAEQSEEAAAHV